MATDRAEATRNKADLDALFRDILTKLADRKQFSPWEMVFVADGLNSIGKTADAERLYRQIITRAESDPAFANASHRAVTRVRAQLVGLLRKKGDFAAALAQAERLIADNPRALEPLMEKGRILQAWAAVEPQRYGDAVAHWSALRSRLQAMPKKPAEYYDVMYNVADCLLHEAEHSDDEAVAVERAKLAEQVLKAALVLNPKLNGPDTVARYKTLLDKALVLRQRR